MKKFKMPHIEIKLEGFRTHVFIDGEEIQDVKSFEIRQEAADESPKIRFNLASETRRTLNCLCMLDLPDIYKKFYVDDLKLLKSGIATKAQLNELDTGTVWM